MIDIHYTYYSVIFKIKIDVASESIKVGSPVRCNALRLLSNSFVDDFLSCVSYKIKIKRIPKRHICVL